MEPRISKDTILHIEYSQNIENGDIVVINHNKNRLVRKYIKVNDSIFLLPLDLRFETIVTKPNDLDYLGKFNYITIKYKLTSH